MVFSVFHWKFGIKELTKWKNFQKRRKRFNQVSFFASIAIPIVAIYLNRRIA